MRIEEVDPHQASSVDAWHATYLAADEHGREWAVPYRLEEFRVSLRTEEKGRWVRAFAGVSSGTVLCSGIIETPLLDNLDFAFVAVHTHPQVRRQGHGSAMLAHLTEVARGRGRRLLATEAPWAYDERANGEGVEVVEWLARRGFRLGLVDVQRNLALPVPPSRLAALAAEAAPHHAAYTLSSWVGPVPDDIVESYLALTSELVVEAPVGDLHLEPETADVEALRQQEATLAEQRRLKVNTVALDAAGDVVAFTDLVVPAHDHGRAYQWGTLVRRQDRGHRLGLAVKVANLQLLQRERPDAQRLTTYNAEVNEQMVGVNDRLGFRPVERLGEFQKWLT